MITTPRQCWHHKNEMEAHDQKELKIAQNREEETNRQVALNRLHLLILYGPIQSVFDALLHTFWVGGRWPIVWYLKCSMLNYQCKAS